MSKSNTLVAFTPKMITHSEAKQDSQLAKIVDKNQKGSLKIKESVRIEEILSDNKYQYSC